MISGSNGPVSQNNYTIPANNSNSPIGIGTPVSIVPVSNINNTNVRTNSYTNGMNSQDHNIYMSNNVYPPVPPVNGIRSYGPSVNYNNGSNVSLGYPNYPQNDQTTPIYYTNGHSNNNPYSINQQQQVNSQPNYQYDQIKPNSNSNPSMTLIPPSTIKIAEEFKTQPRTPINMPDIPHSFPDLEQLTLIQLERLNTDQAALAVIYL